MRTVNECGSCSKTLELAKLNPPRCFNCYRREEREAKKLGQPGLAKEQKKNRHALTKMMDALDDLTLVPEATKDKLRELLQPEVAKIYLPPSNPEPIPVNGEQEEASEPIEVNGEPEEVSELVHMNGEREGTSERVHSAA